MKKKIPALRFPGFDGEWDEKNLKQVSINAFQNGVFNDPQKTGTGYRLINVKDMYVGNCIDTEKLTLLDISEKEFIKNKVEYGDIFFTRSSLVKEGIAHTNINLSTEQDITFDGHLIRMRPDKTTVYPEFLAYLFKTSTARTQFVSRGKTTTMTTIGQEDIADAKVALPPLPEQQKIAGFLTAVDEKINRLTRKKTLLEQYKKGVMQQIFAQEIRFKDDEGKAFPEWEVKRLGELTQISAGCSIRQDSDNSGYKVSRIETISDWSINIKKIGYIKTGEDISSYRLQLGDILFSNINSVKHIGKVAFVDKDYDLYHGMNLLRIKPTKINAKYLYIYLCTYQLKKRFESICNKAVSQASINQTELSKTVINFPTLPEQQKIADFLTGIDKKIEQVDTQLETTKQWKRGLLQQLFV